MPDPQLQQLLAHAQAGEADAQFLLSQISLQNGELEQMHHWLQRASGSNHPDAIGALAQCYEFGHGIEQDFDLAFERYDQAIAVGAKMAAFHKAQLLYKSRAALSHQTEIRVLLEEAAKAGIVPALRSLGYLAMQDESNRTLAVAYQAQAARMGDPVSSFNLACQLLGDGRDEGNKAQARHWLQQAAAANYPHAKNVLASLGVGPMNANIAAPVSADLDHTLEIFPQIPLFERRPMCSDPPVDLVHKVLDLSDSAYLMAVAQPHLRRAAVIDAGEQEVDGVSHGSISEVRTNSSTYLSFEMIDIISRHIENKILAASNASLINSEPLSILCYEQGEYYRPHYDFFSPRLSISADLMHDGGQRVASAVTCLSEPNSGGATSFPKLDLSVPAKQGNTVWFRNCDADGNIDKRSLHAGDTVTDGDKWVVTKWLREHPTSYLKC